MRAIKVGRPRKPLPAEETDRDFWPEADPASAAYRGRTRRLLYRYMRQSIEVGRLPSLLGRECFPSKVSHHRVPTFEDSVLFVHDVESCLERLEPRLRQMIAMIVLEEYTEEETARIVHCNVRTVRRTYLEALDRLAEEFLRVRLLASFACQDAKRPPRKVTDCNSWK